MIVSVNRLLTQGTIVFKGPSQFLVVRAPISRTLAVFDGFENLLENFERLASRLPLLPTPQQVFLRDHIENRSDVLRHSAMNQDQAICERFVQPFLRNYAIGLHFFVQEPMCGEQSAPADPPFRIALRRWNSVNHLDSREDPSRILPASAGPADPFAQNRAGDDHPCLLGLEPPGKASGLTSRTHQEADDRRKQIGRYSEPRAFGDVVDLAHHFEPMPGPHYAVENLAEVASPCLRAMEGSGPRRSRRLSRVPGNRYRN